MTFEEAHQVLLREFDEACRALRAVHEDVEFLNQNHKTNRVALERFVAATENLFKLKEAWYNVKELAE